ncbi:alpha-mannosidase [Curtobacterium ammoniigenes]|uniref:alpha-mannosidase n=1 Tax=Curtobacterium ammoniigenes TaxID=395387 RepID=UPI00082BC1E6|nr:glycoside hydrolase family 38 C-terminal domain-containing protein [Curtobacterium ammoniigenes]
MDATEQLTVDRARRWLDERVRPAITAARTPLTVEAFALPGEPISPESAIAGAYTAYTVGTPWGPAWSTVWFRMRGQIPERWAGLRVEAVVDLGFDSTLPGFQAEGLAYTPDCAPIKAINPRNQWVPITDRADGGETVTFFVEAAANPNLLDHLPLFPTWQGDVQTASAAPLYTLRQADLTLFDAECHDLALDVDVLLELAGELEPGPRRSAILRGIDAAMDALDLHRASETAAAARAVLEPLLSRPATASEHTLSAIGHAHIDSAWLWPTRETIRKVARTTTSMTQLIDEAPEFIYGMSSAQQYEWLRDHRPEVWERVRAAVADGRFVPLGGMWVESDAVLPSGESIVRQFQYGQRFFEQEFGIRCRGVWLPDSFGYAGALPQLIHRAGFDWFLSQKLSWNQVNTFPHHTFAWEGIDGSRVFSHFPPIDTYNARLTVDEIIGARRRFAEAGRASGSIAAVGYGDGGGGTTREMIGRARRLASLEGSPRVVWEHPDAFFDRARRELPDPPVWVGELVLEAHRGTLTSQHRTKQGNRRGEQLLVEAELWATTATVRAGAAYPYDELDRLWKTLLLHQFHDILPGSSIAWVHREAVATYTALVASAEAIIARALDALGGGESPETSARLPTGEADAGLPARYANPAPFERRGVPAFAIAPPTQPARVDGRAAVRVDGDDAGWTIDTGSIRVRVDRHGLITSAVHAASGREAVAPGAAWNLLQLHQDFPNTRDAWDLDAHYRNRVDDLRHAASVTCRQDDEGAHIDIERRFSASTVRQTLRFEANSSTITIDQRTDWHEHERILKLAFPLALHAHRTAAETQYGVVQRPTHTNTSWQTAQFEHSMHRFVYAGEPDFGVGLIGDSTYGYDVQRASDPVEGVTTTVRLSLLRGPRYPDPETDQGVHSHRFTIVVGADLAATTRAAVEADAPLRALPAGQAVDPVVTVVPSAGTAMVTAVKLAADGSGDLIVRISEPVGQRAIARVVVDEVFHRGRAVTLLEAETDRWVGMSPEADGTVRLAPFEVLTLRYAREGGGA